MMPIDKCATLALKASKAMEVLVGPLCKPSGFEDGNRPESAALCRAAEGLRQAQAHNNDQSANQTQTHSPSARCPCQKPSVCRPQAKAAPKGALIHRSHTPMALAALRVMCKLVRHANAQATHSASVATSAAVPDEARKVMGHNTHNAQAGRQWLKKLYWRGACVCSGVPRFADAKPKVVIGHHKASKAKPLSAAQPCPKPKKPRDSQAENNKTQCAANANVGSTHAIGLAGKGQRRYKAGLLGSGIGLQLIVAAGCMDAGVKRQNDPV